jgi:hypothetical protein
LIRPRSSTTAQGCPFLPVRRRRPHAGWRRAVGRPPPFGRRYRRAADARLSAEQRARLVLELEDLFAVARVDLVVLPEANAPLAAEEAESQLFYLRRAGDLAPFYSEQFRDLLGIAP